ncbi:MAG TPA: Fic family protein [Acidimicrobiia bacterium]|jgi:Fic family protein
MPGGELPIVWNGRRATAWVPDPLLPFGYDPPGSTVRALERAAGAVRHAGRGLPASWEPLARLLLRAEGVASSNIEGLRAPAVDVIAAELGATQDDAAGDAMWVTDNLRAVTDALDDASLERPLSVERIHEWHGRLMAHSGIAAQHVGVFRAAQGWIGGRSPLDAAFVPPPPDRVPHLIDDLIAFVNRDDIDAITQAAIAHGQFETIHPYADGNGRIGRVLVLWVLARRLDVTVPPPVSVQIARDPGGYVAGLYWFRTGEFTRWLSWFASVVESAAASVDERATELDTLMREWRHRLANVRSDSAAHRILDLLPAQPVLSTGLAAQMAGVSDTAARAALTALASRRIVDHYAPRTRSVGRPGGWWYAPALVDLVAR